MTASSYLKGLANTLVKYRYILIAVAAGLLLLLWPFGGGEEAPPEDEKSLAFDLAEKEERLAKLLSSIAGVGRVEVMLTLDSDMEYIYAVQSDRQTESDGAAKSEDIREEYIVLKSGDGGEELVAVKTLYPRYKGALIVCEGGDNLSVKWCVLQAVSALTGLSSDKITIAEMK